MLLLAFLVRMWRFFNGEFLGSLRALRESSFWGFTEDDEPCGEPFCDHRWCIR